MFPIYCQSWFQCDNTTNMIMPSSRSYSLYTLYLKVTVLKTGMGVFQGIWLSCLTITLKPKIKRQVNRHFIGWVWSWSCNGQRKKLAALC